ncbi:ubiquitin-like modifier-activating enzyme 1 isoform X2 [Contarinia nasturtii]|uniref:ubiquitin-like modifier-activating enzyme 1 isoform X2 n=1 Tax=Contarinia nasturtii TaxID=265458 RepID=UPI0012D37D9C|nr:ubiquitin-like modifier-activating enzyme 1 isoform X2 [Contarinia nasturtii]
MLQELSSFRVNTKTSKCFEMGDLPENSLRVKRITRAKKGFVECHERHGLEDGDYITFFRVRGMTGLNGQIFKIKIRDAYEFFIGNTEKFKGRYEGGGVVFRPVLVSPPRISYEMRQQNNEDAVWNWWKMQFFNWSKRTLQLLNNNFAIWLP